MNINSNVLNCFCTLLTHVLVLKVLFSSPSKSIKNKERILTEKKIPKYFLVMKRGCDIEFWMLMMREILKIFSTFFSTKERSFFFFSFQSKKIIKITRCGYNVMRISFRYRYPIFVILSNVTTTGK